MDRCCRGDVHRTASWHPTIDVDVELYEIEKEDERLSELNSKLDVFLFSSDTSSTPPNAMPGESET